MGGRDNTCEDAGIFVKASTHPDLAKPISDGGATDHCPDWWRHITADELFGESAYNCALSLNEDPSDAGDGQSSTTPCGSSSAPYNGQAQTPNSKRRIERDSIDDGHIPDNLQSKRCKYGGSTDVGDSEGRWACPFQKFDPTGEPYCGQPKSGNASGGFSNMSRLK
jgi:hypothetical protein